MYDVANDDYLWRQWRTYTNNDEAPQNSADFCGGQFFDSIESSFLFSFQYWECWLNNIQFHVYISNYIRNLNSTRLWYMLQLNAVNGDLIYKGNCQILQIWKISKTRNWSLNILQSHCWVSTSWCIIIAWTLNEFKRACSLWDLIQMDGG